MMRILIIALLLITVSCAAYLQTSKTNAVEPKVASNASPRKVVETKVKVRIVKGELTTSNIAQDRQLKNYENGGHFNCRQYADSSDARSCDLEKLREFVWRKWKKKERGYLRVTGDSVDAASTSHIFIEPDDDGTWRIMWRIVRDINLVHDVLKITDLKKRVATSEIDCFNFCKIGTEVLSFQDEFGNEIQSI